FHERSASNSRTMPRRLRVRRTCPGILYRAATKAATSDLGGEGCRGRSRRNVNGGLLSSTRGRSTATARRFWRWFFSSWGLALALPHEPIIDLFGGSTHLRAEVTQRPLSPNESYKGCVKGGLPLVIPAFLEPGDQSLGVAARFHKAKETEKIVEKGRRQGLCLANEGCLKVLRCCSEIVTSDFQGGIK